MDGTTASIETTGTALGTLLFYAARIPRSDVALPISATFIDPDTYQVTVAHPALWYIWLRDDDGFSVPAAVWVGYSSEADISLVGEGLRNILEENRAAINAALQEVQARCTVKHIIYGGPAGIRDFPAILVGKPRETAEYVFIPFGRQHTYSFEIDLIIRHSDQASRLPWATNMCGRLMEILNQPAYSSMVLASGLELSFDQVREGEADEPQIGENVWCAIATLLWSGNALKQDTGGLI